MPDPQSIESSTITSAERRFSRDSVTYPLDEFYAMAELKLPRIESIPGDEMPEPFRTLLVHQNDMTPTLEQFHGRDIHIKALRTRRENGFYFREVILVLNDTLEVVEFGAIKIDLKRFAPEPARLVLEEKLPLGHILHQFQIRHTSEPTAYLKIGSDDFINESLNLSRQHTLYGRRNTLWTPDRKPLAEIVEILPPEKSS